MKDTPHYISALFLALLILSCPALNAQTTSWKLKKDKAGIKVYTRSVEGFDLAEFRGEITIPVSVDKIVATLKDVDRMIEWIPDNKSTKLLKMDGTDQYHYIETDAPFPLRDRDAVLHFQYTESEGGVKVLVEGKPEYLPAKDGLVRIPYIKGYWLLEPLADGQTAVTYQARADPGGAIPTWIANAGVVTTPFDTLENLRTFLQ